MELVVMLKNSKLVLATLSIVCVNGVCAAENYSSNTDALSLQIAMENSVETGAADKRMREIKNAQKDTWNMLVARKVEADIADQKAIQAAYEDLNDTTVKNQETYLAIYNAIIK